MQWCILTDLFDYILLELLDKLAFGGSSRHTNNKQENISQMKQVHKIE